MNHNCKVNESATRVGGWRVARVGARVVRLVSCFPALYSLSDCTSLGFEPSDNLFPSIHRYPPYPYLRSKRLRKRPYHAAEHTRITLLHLVGLWHKSLSIPLIWYISDANDSAEKLVKTQVLLCLHQTTSRFEQRRHLGRNQLTVYMHFKPGCLLIMYQIVGDYELVEP